MLNMPYPSFPKVLRISPLEDPLWNTIRKTRKQQTLTAVGMWGGADLPRDLFNVNSVLPW